MPARLNISGMGCRVGAYDNVAYLERALYHGFTGTEIRSSEAGESGAPAATAITPPMLAAVDEAMFDAGFEPPGAQARHRVAVVVLGGQETNRPAVQRVLRRWRLTAARTAGPETGITRTLDHARQIMLDPLTEAVLVVACEPGREAGAAALVLTRGRPSAERGGPGYATIETATIGSGEGLSGIDPHDIQYLELRSPNGLADHSVHLAERWSAETLGSRHTAIGMAPIDIGSIPAVGPLIGLIRGALCVHHGYVPGTPSWPWPVDAQHKLWDDSALYAPAQSRPWPRPSRNTARHAAVSTDDANGRPAYTVLSGASARGDIRPVDWARAQGCLTLPISGAGIHDLLAEVSRASEAVEAGADVEVLARGNLDRLPPTGLRAMFCAPNIAALQRELLFGQRTMAAAHSAKRDWMTPNGSYFPPAPLGPTAKVALIYPGAFNSYPHLGIDTFRYFPGILPWFERQTDRLASLLHHRKLYPRTIGPITQHELAKAESALLNDISATSAIAACFGLMQTHLMRRLLHVPVAGSLGYSLGEISMTYGMGCLAVDDVDPDGQSGHDDPVFKQELFGDLRAVRTAWHITETTPSSQLWASWTLMAKATDIHPILERFDRVFLTHVNSPEELVIAGDPRQCEAVTTAIDCDRFRLPTALVMHCPLVDQVRMAATLKKPATAPPPGTELFSTSRYGPIKDFTDTQVAGALARSLGHTIDFPRLVRTVHDHGYRYFIEVGPGSSCTRWIHEILRDKPHIAESMDRRGATADTDIARVVARLFCHGVPVDLSALTPAGCAARNSASCCELGGISPRV